jgi:uncharacterized protein (DUF433 family)
MLSKSVAGEKMKAASAKLKTKAATAADATKRARRTREPRTLYKTRKELVVENYGGEPYEYYPLGKYIVVAPGVCGGRPTFKYTRIRVEFILDLLAANWTIEQITHKYRETKLTAEGVQEAITLAKKAFVKTLSDLPVAV